jgi:predicted transcriptional regulator
MPQYQVRVSGMSEKQRRSMEKWWTGWNKLGDHDRSVWRAQSVRRLIAFWEIVKTKRRWTSITELAPLFDGQRRWVRRNLYTLEKAGLVEIQHGARQLTFFRRSRKAWL